MASIVLELQHEALYKTVSTSDLLRKALVVAKKLSIREFEAWITSELEGYSEGTDIPEYRRITGQVRVWNPFRGWQPMLFETTREADAFSTRMCNQRVAEIESLLDNRGDRSSLQMPYTSETERQLREAIDFDTTITLIVPYTGLVRILDAVRNIVLKWSMKLEEDGILGEGLTFTVSEKQQAESHSYTINNFYGPVQGSQIQQASQHSVQNMMYSSFDPVALQQLVSELRAVWSELTLSPDNEAELDAEVKTIEAQIESPNPKQTVVKECLRSVRRILEAAGGTVAAHILLQHAAVL